ncbi:hypothetical protein TanjilG_06420 [Lupinus angustifolius]|uniref:Uncharacterized protein n=1 Tax=Lupinus angustifolius TaxID=3871 RepID=A0A1J7GWQ6_LUPAN|nr:PREDICTED: uncharacterized protein LOC109357397 [Lupinus angustifolius]XP_019456885.1 PREDICTED: uncharacterized protein LOC109357397 [Lupinus angustifolius]XP_019456886.1 PREDICTED: uncharacterized protein LOC109357397 [Lupinus angustifolius]OIW05008.1 hypothetical protein TanjilG_06420 [Lupinus angustifolius]
METLVVMSQHQHRNQYYSSNRPKPQGSYCSSPSKDFRVINCKTFQRGNGILPTPFKSCAYSSPVTKRASSPKTPSDNKTLFKTSTLNSTPIPINAKACKKDTTLIEGISDNRTLCKTRSQQSTPILINGNACKMGTAFSDGSLLLSELWAGPTYSNSPPPSSLPIPKFSVTPAKTVSLDLPGSSPEIEMHYPVAKSALSSPRRECSSCMLHLFVKDDSATKMLCRVLNLNLNDE